MFIGASIPMFYIVGAQRFCSGGTNFTECLQSFFQSQEAEEEAGPGEVL